MAGGREEGSREGGEKVTGMGDYVELTKTRITGMEMRP